MDKRLLIQGGKKLRDLVLRKHIIETDIRWMTHQIEVNKQDIKRKQKELEEVNKQIADLKK